jgi:DNA-binding SARP family transcriptional activator
MATAKFRVLGPLQVEVDGAALTLGGARQRAVLGVLLLENGRVVPTDRIIELIWGEDQGPKTGGTLQVYVSNLRRALEPATEARGRPVIVTRQPGYLVDLDPEELDLTELHESMALADSTRGADPATAATALRQAAQLFRGATLSDLDPTLASLTASIDALRPTVLSRLAEAELALGRHREILDELRQWSTDHPYDEALRGQLMLSLYRSGRQRDALRTYSEGRELLADQLGIEPSRELRQLEADILNQDPALDADTPRRTTSAGAVAFDSATVLRSVAAEPDAYLELDGRAVPLDRPVITLGRHPDRHVVVLDPRASRLHAEIRRGPDGHTLVDAGSANGTLVNGERRDEAQLADGDVIQIGDTELVFRSGATRR